MRILLIAVAAIAVCTSLLAQEAATWPPDTDALFSPDIEILETTVEHIEARIDDLPRLNHQQRMIQVFDANAEIWREYPYPDAFENASSIDELADGLLLVWGDGKSLLTTGEWLLNTETGEFTPPRQVCDELHMQLDVPRWITLNWFDDENEYGRTVFCSIETGQVLLVELPDEYEDRFTPYFSPDGNHALLMARQNIYSYDLASGTLLELGSTTNLERVTVDWVGDEQVLISETGMADMSYPWIHYSVANFTQEHSLEYITWVYKPGTITTRDNPLRYEWVDVIDDECYLVHLHADDGQRDLYPLDDLCELGQVIGSSDERLYSPMVAEEGGSIPIAREIVRFNPYNGERSDVLTGEVEYVMDVSADGEYAVLVMDDNGQIDMVDEIQAQSLGKPAQDRPPHFRLVIISLRTGEELYSIPTDVFDAGFSHYPISGFNADSGIVFDTATPALRTFPEDWMFHIGGQRFLFNDRNSGDDKLVTLSADGAEETPVGFVHQAFADGDWLLVTVHSAESDAHSVVLVDANTQQEYLLLPDVRVVDYNRFFLGDYEIIITPVQPIGQFRIVVKNYDADEWIQYIIRRSL